MSNPLEYRGDRKKIQKESERRIKEMKKKRTQEKKERIEKKIKERKIKEQKMKKLQEMRKKRGCFIASNGKEYCIKDKHRNKIEKLMKKIVKDIDKVGVKMVKGLKKIDKLAEKGIYEVKHITDFVVENADIIKTIVDVGITLGDVIATATGNPELIPLLEGARQAIDRGLNAVEKVNKVSGIAQKSIELGKSIKEHKNAMDIVKQIQSIINDSTELSGNETLKNLSNKLDNAVVIGDKAIKHKEEIKEIVEAAKEAIKEKDPEKAKQIMKDTISQIEEITKDVKEIQEIYEGKEVKEEVKEEVKKPVKTGLESMKVTELKMMAKQRGLSGYSKLKKQELIDLLKKDVSSSPIPSSPHTGPKRKLSAYNIYIKNKTAEGMSFTEAARSWKSSPENPKNK